MDQIRQRAMRAILREIGPVGLALFMAEGGRKEGDYTVDRHMWLPRYESTAAFLEACKREGDPEKIRAELFGDETELAAPDTQA